MENPAAQRSFLPDWFYLCRIAVIIAARDDPVAAGRDIADGKARSALARASKNLSTCLRCRVWPATRQTRRLKGRLLLLGGEHDGRSRHANLLR